MRPFSVRNFTALAFVDYCGCTVFTVVGRAIL